MKIQSNAMPGPQQIFGLVVLCPLPRVRCMADCLHALAGLLAGPAGSTGSAAARPAHSCGMVLVGAALLFASLLAACGAAFPLPEPASSTTRRATAAGSQRHSRCLHPPAGRDPLSCCPRHCCCRELPPARPQMLAGCSTKRSTPSPASASTSTASLGASLLSSTSIPPIRTGALSSNGWRGRVRPAAILAGAGYAAERR